MASPRVQTVINALKKLEDISDESCLSYVTEDYHHTVAPSSAHGGSPPTHTRASFNAFLAHLAPVVKGFYFTILDTLEDEKQNRVVVVATNEIKFREEVKDTETDWAYKGEYVFIFDLDETGQKIKHMAEFVDSIGVGKLGVLIKRAHENLAKKNGN